MVCCLLKKKSITCGLEWNRIAISWNREYVSHDPNFLAPVYLYLLNCYELLVFTYLNLQHVVFVWCFLSVAQRFVEITIDEYLRSMIQRMRVLRQWKFPARALRRARTQKSLLIFLLHNNALCNARRNDCKNCTLFIANGKSGDNFLFHFTDVNCFMQQ